MNIHTLSIIVAGMAAISAKSFAGLTSVASPKAPERASALSIHRHELQHWGENGPLYSPIFGLVLSHDAPIFEEIQLDKDVAADARDAAMDQYSELSEKAKEAAARQHILLLDDYVAKGLNKRLYFPEGGNAVLLRIRNKFQFLNEASDAASFTYLDDRKSPGDSGTQWDAAAMVDVYLNPLYNQDWGLHPLSPDPYQFWLRLGAEYHQNSLNKEAEAETASYYALLNFQANPAQKARFLGWKRSRISSPQFVQLGVAYDDNRLSGVDDFRWIVGWQPRFVLNKKHGWFGQGLALGNPMYYRKGSFGRFFHGPEAKESDGRPETQSHIFTFVNPVIRIEGPSDARGNFAGRVDLPNFKDDKSLKDLRDEVVSYKVDAGIGFWDGRFTLSYSLSGVHPVASLSEGHISHEFKAELNLTKAFKDNETGKDVWAGLSAYVSYTRGEQAPSFADVDQIKAGVQLRF